MIDPSKVCLFVPAGLKKFKLHLFTRIGETVKRAGGRVALHDAAILDALPLDVIPVVGCQPESTPLIKKWRASGRKWVYWDRGYWSRVFATWLPRGENGGMYRWHVGSFQLQQIRDAPSDRLDRDRPPVKSWSRGGRHVVIAQPTVPYAKFHELESWTDATLEELAKVTDRQIVIRCKGTKRPLQSDLRDAHALVTHGSNAAVEAAILGCPVFVHESSAAALVGRTDLTKIEDPVYPEREAWLRALAYSHFSEPELVDGTLWRLLR